MRPIVVTIPHNLGKAEARRRVTEGFGQMREQLTSSMAGQGGSGGGLLGGAMRSMFSFQDRWNGDRLEFEGGGLGQKVTGRIDVGDESVVMQVDLPEMLAALADRVMGQLQQQGKKLLSGPPT